MALPTVVTDVPGPADLATRATAWLLDPGTRGRDGFARPRTDDLAAALREIRRDLAAARRRGRAGRERVVQLFHPGVVADALLVAIGSGVRGADAEL